MKTSSNSPRNPLTIPAVTLPAAFLLLFTAWIPVTTANPSSKNSESKEKSDSAAATEDASAKKAVATFGNGCFWCTEAVLERLDGVSDVVSGYMGGHVKNPTYEQVCGKKTGHAEVVQVTYDPAKITYDELLYYFWNSHDPTTKNRQGNDIGPQYRSVIFYHDTSQKLAAENSMAKENASGKYPGPIVTEITEASTFWKAEAEHQDFFERNPSNPYCRALIPPKLRKLGLE